VSVIDGLGCLGIGLLVVGGATAQQPGQPQPTSPKPASSLVDRCNLEIARQTQPLLKKYLADLTVLRTQYQRQGDLHSLLATQSEAARVERELSLTNKDALSQPEGLSTLQAEYLKELNAIRTKILDDVITYCDSQIKALTKAGRLDEATNLDLELTEIRNARDRSLASRPASTRSSRVTDPNFLSAPQPPYPYEARAHHITGSGVCLMKFDPRTGECTDAQMIQSTGNNLLDQSAVSTFRRWRVKPGSVTEVRHPITFTMAGASY